MIKIKILLIAIKDKKEKLLQILKLRIDPNI